MNSRSRKSMFEQLERRELLAGIAIDDTYEMSEDRALVVQVKAGVLANDTNISFAVLESGPTNGKLIFNKNGSFGYQPNPDFVGSDTFVYTDMDREARATVTIDVVVDAGVVIANDDLYTITHDRNLNVHNADGVLINDENTKVATLTQPPQHGSVNLHPKGGFVYHPDPNWAGTDTFYYTAIGTDGADSAMVTIEVTNQAPVANDDAYTTDEDTPLTVPTPKGLLANDTDGDGDNLTVALVDGPQHGTLQLNEQTGQFVYTPDENYYGSDQFTYVASDGIASSATATVTLTIDPVNDAPVAMPDSYETFDNESLVVGAPGVLLNDYDVDDVVLTTTLVSGPTKGVFLAWGGDGSFAYEPELSAEDYVATFEYAVVDAGGLSSTATVTIYVTASPVVTNDDYDMLEDDVLTANFMDNDKNLAGFYASVFDQPQNGSLIYDAETGAFTYQPNADFVGVDTFTYIVDNGEMVDPPVGVVTITVHQDIIGAAIYNDEGFKTSDQLADGDLDKAADISKQMVSTIMEASNQTGVFADGDISVQDIFLLNDYLTQNYLQVDTNGDPIWVDGTGSIVERQLNTGTDHYYVGWWGDWHGDDAGGRLQYGYTGDAIEHGYHLIQNDGGTTTLDGTPGGYTLNYAGGGGTNFWTNVVDGLFHMGFDIVTGENGALAFADDYQEGVDYYFLNEDGDRNENLNDVADWLTFLLQ